MFVALETIFTYTRWSSRLIMIATIVFSSAIILHVFISVCWTYPDGKVTLDCKKYTVHNVIWVLIVLLYSRVCTTSSELSFFVSLYTSDVSKGARSAPQCRCCNRLAERVAALIGSTNGEARKWQEGQNCTHHCTKTRQFIDVRRIALIPSSPTGHSLNAGSTRAKGVTSSAEKAYAVDALRALGIPKYR